MSCRGFLQCNLKVLNFLLTLVGALIVLYSLWMLNQWHKYGPIPTPSPAPTGDDFSDLIANAKSTMETLNLPSGNGMPDGQPFESLTFVMDSATELKTSFFPDHLPAPWFIYAFLGFGILSCLITCTGHIAAETISSCCLSCYTLLILMFLIVQGAIVAAIFFDPHWRKDIPNDPTGQLDNIIRFVEENYNIFKWMGVGVVVVEALSLLVSLILRALADPRKSGYDSDDEYLPRTGPRAPLVNRQPAAAGNPPAAGGAPAENSNRAVRTDEWSKRMREKYGLDTTEFSYNPSESRRFQQGAPVTEEKKGSNCTIM